MRTTLATGLAALVLALPATAGTDRILVGFSQATIDGFQGIFAMNALCQAEWPGSATCTVAEVYGTTEVPELPADTQAWIRLNGDPVGDSYENCGGQWGPDPSGPSQTIEEWEEFNGFEIQGPAIDNLGRVGVRARCGTPRPVTCCRACVPGDADGDGQISSVDARLVQRAAVGLLPETALKCAP